MCHGEKHSQDAQAWLPACCPGSSYIEGGRAALALQPALGRVWNHCSAAQLAVGEQQRRVSQCVSLLPLCTAPRHSVGEPGLARWGTWALLQAEQSFWDTPFAGGAGN